MVPSNGPVILAALGFVPVNRGVRFGAPLDFSRYDGLVEVPAIRRAVTDEIVDAICELSGGEYEDSYRTRSDLTLCYVN